MYAYFDTETKGLYGEFLCGAVLYNGQFIFIDNLYEMKKVLSNLLQQGYILVGHNVMYDFSIMDFKPESYKQFEDTYLLAKAIQGIIKQTKFGLQELVESLTTFKYTLPKQHIQKMLEKGYTHFDVRKYLEEDVTATQTLFEFFLNKHRQALKNKTYLVDKAFLLHLIDIQKRGITFDIEGAFAEYQKLKIIAKETAEGFYKKFSVNINSPIQLQKKFKLATTSRTSLIEFLLENKQPELKPVIESLIHYKKLKKRVEFLEKFIQKAKKNNGRIYGKFSPCGAISGRLSCSDENLMQIPRDLRKFFKTDKYFLIYDFSQIELRLAGQIWKEPIFIKTFQEKEDLHSLTAKILFKKENITKEERFVGKTFNFAMLYGATEKTLRALLIDAGLNYPVEVVTEFRKNWLNTYKTIRNVHYETLKTLKEQQYVIVNTMLNRLIYTTKFNEALNIPIQGTGAELLKGVILKFLRKFPEAKIINLIHDEIQIECETKEEAETYLQALNQCLQEAWHNLFPEVLVPVEGEGQISKTLEKP